jgi:hypothetical protein
VRRERLGRRGLARERVAERAGAVAQDRERRRAATAEGLGDRARRHHGARAALVQERGVRVGRQERAHHDRHAAVPHRPEDGEHRLGAVGQRDEDALLVLHAEARERGRRLPDAAAQLPARHLRPPRVAADADGGGRVVTRPEDRLGGVHSCLVEADVLEVDRASRRRRAPAGRSSWRTSPARSRDAP